MAGFRNAPSVTEFKVGMGVMRPGTDAGWRRIAWISESGVFTENGSKLSSNIDWYNLDLDSIWVGRKYIWKDTNETTSVELVALWPAGNRVFYRSSDGSVSDAGCDWFKKYYEPLPLSSSEPPVKVGEIVWVQDGEEDWFGRVDQFNEDNDKFRIVGPKGFYRWCKFDVTITKLVPEKKEK